MSRKIVEKSSVTITEEEAKLRQTTASQRKLLFTSYHGQRCALSIQDNRLAEASFFPKIPSKIGSIYIGKVKNVVNNINACFVEIEKGELCFLSLKENTVLQPLNRIADGRILEGDDILVQVIRDAQKSKRASVTTQISLSNDYFVLSMGSKKVCYSTKLSRKQKERLNHFLLEAGILNMEQEHSMEERHSIEQMHSMEEKHTREKSGYLAQECQVLLSDACLTRLKSEGLDMDSFILPSTGMIVRTKTEESESKEELLTHFYDLTAQYIRLLYVARYRSCFSCLKRADTEIETVLQQFAGYRDRAAEDLTADVPCYCDAKNPEWEIITDQESSYEQLMQYKRENALEIPIRLYQDSMLSLSALYAVEGKMRTALDRRVWLKSGGYLVIEPTEALTVIDVNSGKCEDGKNPQDTYRRINLEAAREAAFQLRLRNLSGIIIVDFINMRSSSDNSQLLHVLKSLVKQDKVLTTVIDMTPLGLVEITRKKISKPLWEQLQFSDKKQ
nr:ribonuclease E/G [uncultured Acetatifactor sp.]